MERIEGVDARYFRDLRGASANTAVDFDLVDSSPVELELRSSLSQLRAVEIAEERPPHLDQSQVSGCPGRVGAKNPVSIRASWLVQVSLEKRTRVEVDGQSPRSSASISSSVRF